jgi:hypothetical protein
MTRQRYILRYLPAVVLGLVVAAWGLSLVAGFGTYLRIGSKGVSTCAANGTFFFVCKEDPSGQSHFVWRPGIREGGPPPFGYVSSEFDPPRIVTLLVPLALITTAMLPLVVGGATGFRFHLWHYLAYTALVSIELTYYLRWPD